MTFAEIHDQVTWQREGELRRLRYESDILKKLVASAARGEWPPITEQQINRQSQSANSNG